MWVHRFILPAYEFAQVLPEQGEKMTMVICVKKFPSELGGTAPPRRRVGWVKFKTNMPCLESTSLDFEFDIFPEVSEMGTMTDAEMLKQTCRAIGVNVGKNRMEAAGNILFFMKTACKGVAKATGSGGAQTKVDLMAELLALGVLKGVKKTGKKAGSTMAISELTMEELQCEIDKAKAATEAAVKALKVVVDDSSGTEGENEDQEVEDEEEDGSAEEEEAAESKAEEVGYFAHL